MERTPTDLPLRVCRLRPGAKLPVRAHAGTVVYDLHADLSDLPSSMHNNTINGLAVHLSPGRSVAVPTGIAVTLPPGTYGRIVPLFGLAPDSGPGVLGGIVDASCHDELNVFLVNTGSNNFRFHHGDRIAALILEKAATPDVLEVDAPDGTG